MVYGGLCSGCTSIGVGRYVGINITNMNMSKSQNSYRGTIYSTSNCMAFPPRQTIGPRQEPHNEIQSGHVIYNMSSYPEVASVSSWITCSMNIPQNDSI